MIRKIRELWSTFSCRYTVRWKLIYFSIDDIEYITEVTRHNSEITVRMEIGLKSGNVLHLRGGEMEELEQHLIEIGWYRNKLSYSKY